MFEEPDDDKKKLEDFDPYQDYVEEDQEEAFDEFSDFIHSEERFDGLQGFERPKDIFSDLPESPSLDELREDSYEPLYYDPNKKIYGEFDDLFDDIDDELPDELFDPDIDPEVLDQKLREAFGIDLDGHHKELSRKTEQSRNFSRVESENFAKSQNYKMGIRLDGKDHPIQEEDEEQKDWEDDLKRLDTELLNAPNLPDLDLSPEELDDLTQRELINPAYGTDLDIDGTIGLKEQTLDRMLSEEVKKAGIRYDPRFNVLEKRRGDFEDEDAIEDEAGESEDVEDVLINSDTSPYHISRPEVFSGDQLFNDRNSDSWTEELVEDKNDNPAMLQLKGGKNENQYSNKNSNIEELKDSSSLSRSNSSVYFRKESPPSSNRDEKKIIENPNRGSREEIKIRENQEISKKELVQKSRQTSEKTEKTSDISSSNRRIERTQRFEESFAESNKWNKIHRFQPQPISGISGNLKRIKGISSRIEKKLKLHGYKTIQSIIEAEQKDLVKIKGIGNKTSRRIKQNASKFVQNMIGYKTSKPAKTSKEVVKQHPNISEISKTQQSHEKDSELEGSNSESSSELQENDKLVELELDVEKLTEKTEKHYLETKGFKKFGLIYRVLSRKIKDLTGKSLPDLENYHPKYFDFNFKFLEKYRDPSIITKEAFDRLLRSGKLKLSKEEIRDFGTLKYAITRSYTDLLLGRRNVKLKRYLNKRDNSIILEKVTDLLKILKDEFHVLENSDKLPRSHVSDYLLELLLKIESFYVTADELTAQLVEIEDVQINEIQLRTLIRNYSSISIGNEGFEIFIALPLKYLFEDHRFHSRVYIHVEETEVKNNKVLTNSKYRRRRLNDTDFVRKSRFLLPTIKTIKHNLQKSGFTPEQIEDDLDLILYAFYKQFERELSVARILRDDRGNDEDAGSYYILKDNEGNYFNLYPGNFEKENGELVDKIGRRYIIARGNEGKKGVHRKWGHRYITKSWPTIQDELGFDERAIEKSGLDSHDHHKKLKAENSEIKIKYNVLGKQQLIHAFVDKDGRLTTKPTSKKSLPLIFQTVKIEGDENVDLRVLKSKIQELKENNVDHIVIPSFYIGKNNKYRIDPMLGLEIYGLGKDEHGYFVPVGVLNDDKSIGRAKLYLDNTASKAVEKLIYVLTGNDPHLNFYYIHKQFTFGNNMGGGRFRRTFPDVYSQTRNCFRLIVDRVPLLGINKDDLPGVSNFRKLKASKSIEEEVAVNLYGKTITQLISSGEFERVKIAKYVSEVSKEDFKKAIEYVTTHQQIPENRDTISHTAFFESQGIKYSKDDVINFDTNDKSTWPDELKKKFDTKEIVWRGIVRKANHLGMGWITLPKKYSRKLMNKQKVLLRFKVKDKEITFYTVIRRRKRADGFYLPKELVKQHNLIGRQVEFQVDNTDLLSVLEKILQIPEGLFAPPLKELKRVLKPDLNPRLYLAYSKIFDEYEIHPILRQDIVKRFDPNRRRTWPERLRREGLSIGEVKLKVFNYYRNLLKKQLEDFREHVGNEHSLNRMIRELMAINARDVFVGETSGDVNRAANNVIEGRWKDQIINYGGAETIGIIGELELLLRKYDHIIKGANKKIGGSLSKAGLRKFYRLLAESTSISPSETGFDTLIAFTVDDLRKVSPKFGSLEASEDFENLGSKEKFYLYFGEAKSRFGKEFSIFTEDGSPFMHGRDFHIKMGTISKRIIEIANTRKWSVDKMNMFLKDLSVMYEKQSNVAGIFQEIVDERLARTITSFLVTKTSKGKWVRKDIERNPAHHFYETLESMNRELVKDTLMFPNMFRGREILKMGTKGRYNVPSRKVLMDLRDYYNLGLSTIPELGESEGDLLEFYDERTGEFVKVTKDGKAVSSRSYKLSIKPVEGAVFVGGKVAKNRLVIKYIVSLKEDVAKAKEEKEYLEYASKLAITLADWKKSLRALEEDFVEKVIDGNTFWEIEVMTRKGTENKTKGREVKGHMVKGQQMKGVYRVKARNQKEAAYKFIMESTRDGELNTEFYTSVVFTNGGSDVFARKPYDIAGQMKVFLARESLYMKGVTKETPDLMDVFVNRLRKSYRGMEKYVQRVVKADGKVASGVEVGKILRGLEEDLRNEFRYFDVNVGSPVTNLMNFLMETMKEKIEQIFKMLDDGKFETIGRVDAGFIDELGLGELKKLRLMFKEAGAGNVEDAYKGKFRAIQISIGGRVRDIRIGTSPRLSYVTDYLISNNGKDIFYRLVDSEGNSKWVYRSIGNEYGLPNIAKSSRGVDGGFKSTGGFLHPDELTKGAWKLHFEDFLSMYDGSFARAIRDFAYENDLIYIFSGNKGGASMESYRLLGQLAVIPELEKKIAEFEKLKRTWVPRSGDLTKRQELKKWLEEELDLTGRQHYRTFDYFLERIVMEKFNEKLERQASQMDVNLSGVKMVEMEIRGDKFRITNEKELVEFFLFKVLSEMINSESAKERSLATYVIAKEINVRLYQRDIEGMVETLKIKHFTGKGSLAHGLYLFDETINAAVRIVFEKLMQNKMEKHVLSHEKILERFLESRTNIGHFFRFATKLEIIERIEDKNGLFYYQKPKEFKEYWSNQLDINDKEFLLRSYNIFVTSDLISKFPKSVFDEVKFDFFNDIYEYLKRLEIYLHRIIDKKNVGDINTDTFVPKGANEKGSAGGHNDPEDYIKSQIKHFRELIFKSIFEKESPYRSSYNAWIFTLLRSLFSID